MVLWHQITKSRPPPPNRAPEGASMDTLIIVLASFFLYIIAYKT